jgi:hypothetical protein
MKDGELFTPTLPVTLGQSLYENRSRRVLGGSFWAEEMAQQMGSFFSAHVFGACCEPGPVLEAGSAVKNETEGCRSLL